MHPMALLSIKEYAPQYPVDKDLSFERDGFVV